MLKSTCAFILVTIQTLVTSSPTELRSLGKHAGGQYTLREVGARNTADWRVWLENRGDPVSFWHDIPLWPDTKDKRIVNFVVEIPRWTDGKIEIKRDEPLNPIFQDTRNGQVRFVESVWPHKTYPFLYGSIPQTWESPNLNHSFTNLPGDNDPIDLFDVGQDPGYTGQVKQVKILGGLPLADGGETDWKMIAIDVNDPIAALVDSFADLERYRPGQIQSFYDWFTYYKVARGDDLIPIIGDQYQSASFAQDIIIESHGWWNELIRGQVDSNEIDYNQTTIKGTKSYVSSDKATKKFDLPKKSKLLKAAEKPTKYDSWYYLDQDFRLIAENN